MRLGNRRASTVAWAVVYFTILILCVVALLCGCESEGNGVASERHNEGMDSRFTYDINPIYNTCSDSLSFGEVVDTKTGVRYLVMYNGSKLSISGITPLLDSNGSVVVDERYVSGTEEPNA